MSTNHARNHGNREPRNLCIDGKSGISVLPCFRVSFVCGAVLALAACSTTRPSLGAPSFDLLITNAQIIDGSGGAPRQGSIAISGGKIAAVGEVNGTSARTIDA